MEKIAAQPQAHWFGDGNGDIEAAVRKRVDLSSASNGLPVLVAYNIPNRHCNGYAGGGAPSGDAYRRWVDGFAAAVGGRPAVVVVEPDALAALDCLSVADRELRLGLIKYAVDTLEKRPRVSVYLDAGHSIWIGPPEMATRLEQAGVARAQGFALNVSNFNYSADELAFGRHLSVRLGGKHFVIDTSRNGLGPSGDRQWCNPTGRALGSPPTTATPYQLVDAYLWIKPPGESDGTCNGGPPAGSWWPEYALELARRSSWG